MNSGMFIKRATRDVKRCISCAGKSGEMIPAGKVGTLTLHIHPSCLLTDGAKHDPVCTTCGAETLGGGLCPLCQELVPGALCSLP